MGRRGTRLSQRRHPLVSALGTVLPRRCSPCCHRIYTRLQSRAFRRHFQGFLVGVLRFLTSCFWFAVVKHAEHEGVVVIRVQSLAVSASLFAALTTGPSQGLCVWPPRWSPLDGSRARPRVPGPSELSLFLSSRCGLSPGALWQCRISQSVSAADLLRLSVKPSRSAIRAVAGVRVPFLSKVKSYSPCGWAPTAFIRSSISGHLSCLSLWAAVSKAAVNMAGNSACWSSAFTLRSKCLPRSLPECVWVASIVLEGHSAFWPWS